MSENSKTQEFPKKLAPCIERGELDGCVEEATRLAQEMGVGAKELLNLSAEEGGNDKYGLTYVIALAAAQSFEGKAKARAYSNAGFAAQHLKKVEKVEKYHKKAIEKYHEAIKNSDSMAYMAKAEIHNNLGWIYANLEQYDRAKKKFEEAHKLDPQNVKVIRNIRALGKVKSEPKISKMQWCIAIALFLGIIATWYLFLTEKLTENIFSVQTIILIAMIIFILFYHQVGRFKTGPIEFEKSTEHKNQLSEAISKIER